MLHVSTKHYIKFVIFIYIYNLNIINVLHIFFTIIYHISRIYISLNYKTIQILQMFINKTDDFCYV